MSGGHDVTMSEPQPSSPAPLAVHRLRFIPYTPSAPTALALSPNTIGGSGRGLLAIGRQNGDIDLCLWVPGADGSVDKAWLPHTTLVREGQAGRKIETLAFALTSGDNYGPLRLRLFSTSGGSVVMEHFLPAEFAFSPSQASGSYAPRPIAKRLPGSVRTLPSYGGVIWCMAASPLNRYLAIGCEDGHIRLIDIRQDRFEHLALTEVTRGKDGSREAVTRTERAKSRIVSLAWGPPTRQPPAQRPSAALRARAGRDAESDSSDDDSSDDDDDEETASESFILAGTSSSVALIYSLSTGRATQRLLLPKSRSEQTIVWSTAVLADGTLVTGDSLGFVTLYDAKTKVPLVDGRFQSHDKGADVLCLAIGSDGKTLYSGSVDQKVAEYALINKKWVHTTSRRLHAHDVKSLVVSPPAPKWGQQTHSTEIVPVLVSASTDFNVVLTPASPPSELTLRRHLPKTSGQRRPTAIVESLANPVSSNPLTTFASTTQRRMPFVPHSQSGSTLAGSGAGCTQLCSAKGWVSLRSAATLELWQLQHQDPASMSSTSVAGSNASTSSASPYRRLLAMEMSKRKSQLISHAVSPDGAYLAVSDLSETKLYSLRLFQGELQPRRVKGFSGVFGPEGAPAASAVTFTSDGRLVLASWPAGIVYVLTLGEEECRVVKAWSASAAVSGKRAVAGRRAATNGHSSQASDDDDDDDDDDAGEEEEEEHKEGSEEATRNRVDLLVVSSDLQYLLCGSGNHLWTYNLDTLSPHPRLLPSVRSRAVDVCPHPRDPAIAIVALQDGSVRLLNLEDNGSKSPARWTALVDGVNAKIAGVRDPPAGLCWAQGGKVLVVHGATWLLTANSMDVAQPPVANGSSNHKRTRSRGAEPAEGARHSELESVASTEPGMPFWSVRLTFRYQPLVHVGPVEPVGPVEGVRGHAGAGLAVIERPFFELAKGIEAAWKRERSYGR
ncbi:unnamed protein product [Parajaminaea phylloscopi]